MFHPRPQHILILLLIPLVMTGCSDPSDERLARMAQNSVQQQAQQNEQMQEQNLRIVEATKELVTADAKSRDDMIQLQRDLAEQESHGRQALESRQRQLDATAHTERRSVDRQRDLLELERQQIAAARMREPIIAAVISTFGLLLASLLPLLLAGFLLFGLRSRAEDDQTALCELLIAELDHRKSPLLIDQADSAPQDQARLLEGPSPTEGPTAA